MARKVFLGLRFQAAIGELTEAGDVVNQQPVQGEIPTLDEKVWLEALAKLRDLRDGKPADNEPKG